MMMATKINVAYFMGLSHLLKERRKTMKVPFAYTSLWANASLA
jgi:hypothetical protein